MSQGPIASVTPKKRKEFNFGSSDKRMSWGIVAGTKIVSEAKQYGDYEKPTRRSLASEIKDKQWNSTVGQLISFSNVRESKVKMPDHADRQAGGRRRASADHVTLDLRFGKQSQNEFDDDGLNR